MSQNICEFAKINEMPFSLDIYRVHDGDGIDATLIKKDAKYHESCMFNKSKLQRDISFQIQTYQMYQHPRNLQEKSSTVPAETLISNLEESL